MSRTERYHDLDALRAAAMFLGIAIHGLLSFTERPVAFWPVHDSRTTPLAEFAIFAIHGFRMQIFFLIAGFFGALLCNRYGVAGFLKHRALRVGLPLGLALLCINPVLHYLWLIGDLAALKLVRAGQGQSGALVSADEIAGHFTSGRFLLTMPPLHLWFLYYLALFSMLIIPLVYMGRTAAGRAVAARLRNAQAFLMRHWSGPFLLGPSLLPLLWPMKLWLVDTPEGWTPNAAAMAYYFTFFAFGWLLSAQPEVLAAAGRRWRIDLLAGNLLFLPVYGILLQRGVELLVRDPGHPDLPALKLAAQLAGGTYTWLMIFGLFGLFRRYCARPSTRGRYLADSSYWCYLVSLIPLIALQMAVADRDWNLAVKLSLVLAGAVGLLLLGYEFLVRSSWVGALLNGRKERARPRPGVAAPVGAG